MKKNITYLNGWHSWIETCDRCGIVIRANNTLSTSPPKTDEADFCYSCLCSSLEGKIKKE